MSVPFKNRTATIKPVGQITGDHGILSNPGLTGVTYTVKGYMEPRTITRAYEDWGLVLTRPSVFFCDLTDEAKFPVDAEVTVSGVKYTVSDTRPYNAGAVLDHAEILLDSLEKGKPAL